MDRTQAKRFVQLIQTVKAHKHFDKEVFKSGKYRCPAGILADTNKKWEWSEGDMPRLRAASMTTFNDLRFFFGLNELETYPLSETYALFDADKMKKKAWLKLAYGILDKYGWEEVDA